MVGHLHFAKSAEHYLSRSLFIKLPHFGRLVGYGCKKCNALKYAAQIKEMLLTKLMTSMRHSLCLEVVCLYV